MGTPSFDTGVIAYWVDVHDGTRELVEGRSSKPIICYMPICRVISKDRLSKMVINSEVKDALNSNQIRVLLITT